MNSGGRSGHNRYSRRGSLRKPDKILKRQTSKQVQSDDERQIVKGIALAWFKKHRPTLVSLLGEDQVGDIDEIYRGLIDASGGVHPQNEEF